jgi:hypothetical protein
MVGATALIAGGRARTTEPSAGHKSSIVSTSSTSDATASARDNSWGTRGRAGSSDMANLTARVAASAGASAAETERRAIRLHVT